MLVGIVSSSLVAVVAMLVVRAFIKHLQFRHEVNRLPGWNGLPLIGDALHMKSDTLQYFRQITGLCIANYDAGICKIWLGTKPSVLLYRAHTVEELYKNTKHMTKNFLYNFLVPWLGDGLLISTGEKWFDRRRLITPTFHFKILEQFVHVFNEQAGVLVRLLDAKAAGPGFDFQPYIYRCMLDIICESAMGVKINAQEQTESEFVRTIYRQSEIILNRMKYPWLWPNWLFHLFPDGREHDRNLKVLHGFTRKVIMGRQAELANKISDREESSLSDDTMKTGVESADDFEQCVYLSKKRRRLAFLDMLLESAQNNPSLTVDGIQEEVDTFMFEGHDTTATGMVWILYMLALHPELQVKVQQEVDEVLGDTSRDVTSDDVNQLKYTECFIKETFRLYPPVVWFGRVTSEQCIIGGYTIPKGVSIGVMNHLLHIDPEHFPDPHKFDPDRWLADSAATRHPFCYTPFSAGLRNCIGQRFAMLEEKIVLCHVVRNFKVTCHGKPDDLAPMATLILKPSNAVPVQLQRRRK